MDALGKLEKELREQREKEVKVLMQIVKEEQQSFTQWLKVESKNAQSTIKEDTKKTILSHGLELQKIMSDQTNQLKKMGEQIEENQQRLRGNTPYLIMIVGSLVIMMSGVCWVMRPSPTPPPSIEIPRSKIGEGEGHTQWIEIGYARKMGIKIKVIEAEGK